METMQYIPRLVVLELTHRCTLSCIHCRASAQIVEDKDELDIQDWLKLLDEISSFSRPIIILSGGEVFLRQDVFEIISYAHSKGLTPVIASCGALLTEENIEMLKQAGIKRISISLDGKDASTHDMIRGQKGVFEKALSAMRILKEKGIEFQVNTTVTQHNLDQLKDIFKLIEDYGAVSFHPFFLVPVGRAKQIKDMQLSNLQYEETLNWLYEKSKECEISCRPTCAPHYFRIASQDNFKVENCGLDAKTQGCLAGKSFCFVSSIGEVYPCGFLEQSCGDIRRQNFKEIWQGSVVFNNLRDFSKYKGKCAECEYLTVCGGCRARAYCATGDYLEEEPDCIYQPLSLPRTFI